MAINSRLKAALTGAAVAGMVLGTVVPSQAAGLWSERFSSLRGAKSQSVATTNSVGGWKWSLVQYRAYKYDQKISKFLGRPVSPFCRFFC